MGLVKGDLGMFAVTSDAVGLVLPEERARPGVGTATGVVVLCVVVALGLSVLVQIL